jgi:hypothetical protein
MPTYLVRYEARGPLANIGLTITCPTDEGGTVTRTATPGDIILAINPATPNRGTLYLAQDTGFATLPLPDWPTPLYTVQTGDLIVNTCPIGDIPEQAGRVHTVAADGTLSPLASHPQEQEMQKLVAAFSPYEITAGIVVADTTQGDVVATLPDASITRTILVGNTTGNGSFQINPASGDTIGGDTTLVLGPADKATLVATGTNWEVW